MKTPRPTVVLAAALVLAAAACSSGDGTDGDGALGADFVPDANPPAPASVSLQHGSSESDVVTVDAVVTDTSGVFGVAFDLVFDPDAVTFLAAEEGTLLDLDGADTLFFATATAGRIVVGATRVQDALDSVPDVDATGSGLLASFRFRVDAEGASRVDFDDARPLEVTDRDGVERAVTWSGGRIVAR
jgi:hypothetical protein